MRLRRALFCLKAGAFISQRVLEALRKRGASRLLSACCFRNLSLAPEPPGVLVGIFGVGVCFGVGGGIGIGGVWYMGEESYFRVEGVEGLWFGGLEWREGRNGNKVEKNCG